MPAGRPSEYKEEYCERVLEMGAKGYSVVEMAAELGCDRKTLEQAWTSANPEFFQAFTRARILSQAWWEKIGRDHLVMAPGQGQFQASVWSRSMAARFPEDWRENKGVELTGKNGGPMEVKAIERVIVDPSKA